MKGHVLLLWFLCLSYSNDFVGKVCFELPLVIIRPLEPLPTEECLKSNSPQLHAHCMELAVMASIDVIDNPSGRLNCFHSTPTSQYIQTKLHKLHESVSTSSQNHFVPKHTYSLMLFKEAPFLGLPPHQDWILNGPFFDNSLLRNHLGHWLYRATGRYSSRTRHCVMWMQQTDGKLLYQGIYLLMEQIANGKHRLGLAENNKHCNINEINGGWAWKYSNSVKYGSIVANLPMKNNSNKIYASGKYPVIEYPKGMDMTVRMRNYFVDPNTGPILLFHEYLWSNISQVDLLEHHIELGSFVDYMLHTELSLKETAYSSNIWFTKNRNQPIHAGPVWDFEMAFDLKNEHQPNEWMYLQHQLWKRMMCNYKVASLFISRWKMLRVKVWSNEAIRQFIHQAAYPLQNMLKNCSSPNDDWHDNSMYCTWTNKEKSRDSSFQKLYSKYISFTDEVDCLLQSVLQRAEWMDRNIFQVYGLNTEERCGQGNNKRLPKFNCAKDPMNSDCLNNPQKYFNRVNFSEHQPVYEHLECQPKLLLHSQEITSFDPCWFSSGDESGKFTLFCSGFGTCPEGPDAKCHCLNNSTYQDCSNPVYENDEQSQKSYAFIEYMVFLGVLIMTTMVVFVYITTLYYVEKKINEDDYLGTRYSYYYGT